MKTNRFMRLLSLVLCLCMVLSLVPTISPVEAEAVETQTITINMFDVFGDGWSSNAISVLEDGVQIGIATVAEGKEGTWTYTMDPSKEYAFIWVKGAWSSECYFDIIIAGETVFSATTTDCNLYVDGKVLYPLCEHPNCDAVVTAPTCKKDGYTTYTCTTCGYSYVADETTATGHQDIFTSKCMKYFFQIWFDQQRFRLYCKGKRLTRGIHRAGNIKRFQLLCQKLIHIFFHTLWKTSAQGNVQNFFTTTFTTTKFSTRVDKAVEKLCTVLWRKCTGVAVIFAVRAVGVNVFVIFSQGERGGDQMAVKRTILQERTRLSVLVVGRKQRNGCSQRVQHACKIDRLAAYRLGSAGLHSAIRIDRDVQRGVQANSQNLPLGTRTDDSFKIRGPIFMHFLHAFG